LLKLILLLLGGEKVPTIKSEKKRVIVNQKKNDSNNMFKASMKSSIKKVDNACKSKDKKQAQDLLNIAIKRIDKALSKGFIHKNTANRYKTRLTKNVNNME